MTRTEDRLRDALHASAGRVSDDRLRPLPELWPAAQTAAGRRRAWRRRPGWQLWGGWLVPAAAAVSVALVIGLVAAITGAPRLAAGPGPVSSTATLPRYFAYIPAIGLADHGPADVQVFSTSDGALVAKLPNPKVPGWQAGPLSVAAAPDDRTFYVDYAAYHFGSSSPVEQAWLYRFSITRSGSVTPPARIKGGVLSGAAGVGNGTGLAVSPDGTRLALTGDGDADHLRNSDQGYSDQIIVIDLRTGQQTSWQGGLYRPGQLLTVVNLSWSADGRSLVYLALWCNGPEPRAAGHCTGTSGPAGYRATQVRRLSVAAGGGTLARGAVLLTQSARYPVIAQALAGPASSDLSVLVLSGPPNAAGGRPELTVERVSAVSGSLLGVDYRAGLRGTAGQPGNFRLYADPTGRYLLFSSPASQGLVTGWIDPSQRQLRLLPGEQPNPRTPSTAW